MKKFIIGFRIWVGNSGYSKDLVYLHSPTYITYSRNIAMIFTDKREGDIAIYQFLDDHYFDKHKPLVSVEEE